MLELLGIFFLVTVVLPPAAVVVGALLVGLWGSLKQRL